MTKPSQTLQLMHLRWLILRNHFSRPTGDKWFRWIMIAVLGILFLTGDYVFFWRIIRYMDKLPLEIGKELIVQLLNVVFLTLFAMTLFSSLISSLSIFYMSYDLDFLHALPVRERSLVTVRFAQNVVQSSWMVLLFTLPLFFAYGRYFHVSGGYYLYLMMSLFPFIVLACLVGSLGIMLLMRYFPTQRMYQILSLLGVVFFAGLVVYLRFLSPEKFFGKEVSDEMVMAFVESLRVPTYKYLPSSWITRGITAWVEGSIGLALWQLSYIVLAVVILFCFFLAVSGKVYYSGWCLVGEVKGAPLLKRSVTRGKAILDNNSDWFPMSDASKALMVKDIRIFFRDPAQWSQLFILSALVVVYIFNIINLPLQNVVLKNVVSVLNIGLVGFVMSALVARFVFSAISVEGKMMWTIYTAPVDMRRFVLGKFFLYFPPLLGIAELLVIASNYLLQVDAYVMKASVLAIFLMTAGLVGLGLGMGAMYPMFDHENISEVASSAGGIMFMILSLIFVGMVIVLGARPMYVHFNEQFLFKDIGGLDVIICYALIVVLSMIVTIMPLCRGVRALRRMDI